MAAHRCAGPSTPPVEIRPPASKMDAGPDVDELKDRFRLRGIVRAPGDALAVVNGAVVRVGDRIDGAEVIAIEPRRVRLRVGVGEFYLALRADGERS